MITLTADLRVCLKVIMETAILDEGAAAGHGRAAQVGPVRG